MKKIVCGLICSLMFCAMFFTGCAGSLVAPKGTGDMVKNGEVIVYDDYIYFAGKYTSHDDLRDGDNKDANLDALYRVKLVDGNLEYDEDDNLKNVEKVAGKVLGTENAFMHAVGDQIVFGSPNTHKTAQSKNAFDRTSYFKMKNDGSGLKELYTTKAEVSEQSLLQIGDETIIVVYDGTNLVRINVGTGDVKEIATDVTSAAFAENYTSEFERYAYFVVARGEEQGSESGITGDILKKADLISGEVTTVRQIAFETIKAVDVKNGYFFYTRTTSENDTFYFANKLTGGFEASEVVLTAAIASDITNFTYLGKNQNGEDLPVVFTYQSKLCYSNFGEIKINEILSESVTFLFTAGDYVYYSTSDGIFRISYKDKVAQQITDSKELKTNVSFDGAYIYYFAKNDDNTTGNYYMYRASVRAAENGTGIEKELLSKLDEKDIKEEE